MNKFSFEGKENQFRVPVATSPSTILAPFKVNFNSPFKSGDFLFYSINSGFWDSLSKHPYGFTDASVVITHNALKKLSEIATTKFESSNNFLFQVLHEVIFVDYPNEEDEKDEECTIFALKRSFGNIRLLVLIPKKYLSGSVETIYNELFGSVDDMSIASKQSVYGLVSKTGRDTVGSILAYYFEGLPAIRWSDSAQLHQNLSTVNELRGQKLSASEMQGRMNLLFDWLKSYARSCDDGMFSLSVESVPFLLQLQSSDNRTFFAYPDVESVFRVSGYDRARVSRGKKHGRDFDEKEEEEEEPARKRKEISTNEITPDVTIRPGLKLAIIVPYRDQPEQNRAEQLRRFSEHMSTFLKSPHVNPPLGSFHVIVAEQSFDGFKFNRGKCLNAAFRIASDPEIRRRFGLIEEEFDAFCFHDVDLLPGNLLGPWYSRRPDVPVHIGAVWTRYDYPKYVGGIITMSKKDVIRTNGFPNDFWGWGGEDDEMYRRLEKNKIKVQKPNRSLVGAPGVIVDLEDVLIKEQGGERAGTSVKNGGKAEWRNMWKHENLDKSAENWLQNGVNTVDFEIKAVRRLTPYVSVFTIDLFASKDPFAQKQIADVGLPPEALLTKQT